MFSATQKGELVFLDKPGKPIFIISTFKLLKKQLCRKIQLDYIYFEKHSPKLSKICHLLSRPDKFFHLCNREIKNCGGNLFRLCT